MSTGVQKSWDGNMHSTATSMPLQQNRVVGPGCKEQHTVEGMRYINNKGGGATLPCVAQSSEVARLKRCG